MTKVSFKLIFAALAATAALTGCTKEPTPGQTDQTPASPATEGTRVIAVSFAPQTKTSFTSTEDGIQPTFEEGDEILVCTVPPTENVDPETEICTVTKQLTITTKLTGTLNAFYPADAADLDQESHKIQFPVSGSQTGHFADANMCMALIGENADNASFNNVYTLFIIYPPTGTKVLYVYSLPDIENGAQRTGSYACIRTGGKTSKENCEIRIGDGSSDVPSPCYLVLNPKENLKLSNLSFQAVTSKTEGYIKGIPTSKIAAAADAAVGTTGYDKINDVKSAQAYTIDDSNWHGYVEVGDYKWAVENVGEYGGDYYMWGTSVVAYEDHPSQRDDMVFLVKINPYGEDIYKNTWDKNAGYCWNNTPFTNGVFAEATTKNVFTKYTASINDYAYGNSADGKTTLDLCDDAAYVNWGGAWRIPTSNELESVKDKEGFFVNLGALNMYGVDSKDDFGYYWSSTLDPDYPDKAKCLEYSFTGDGEMKSFSRFWGCTVRAIIDDPDYIATEE